VLPELPLASGRRAAPSWPCPIAGHRLTDCCCQRLKSSWITLRGAGVLLQKNHALLICAADEFVALQ
ncbi:hypothetical protein, partial [Rhizobium leguminosarum]|uniref:hypothetical protein n=1 Tax=Rhizobium leguminosarum TaxID=384 RepID=UPI003F9E2652